VKILDYPIPATSPGCRSPEAHTPPTCQNSHRCSYPPVSPGHAIVRVGVEVPWRGKRGHYRGHSKPRISPWRFRIRRRPLRALGRAKNAKLRANCRHQVRGWALNRPTHLRRPTPAAPGETPGVAPRPARRPDRQARRPRILGVFEGGATPPDGMQRRPNATGILRRDTRPAFRPRGSAVALAEAERPALRTQHN